MVSRFICSLPNGDAACKSYTNDVKTRMGGSTPVSRQSKAEFVNFDRMAKKGKVKLNAQEQTEENAEFLAACTDSFNGWQYKGSADAAAIEAAYKDPTIGFIADQVGKAIGDGANFMNSSANS